MTDLQENDAPPGHLWVETLAEKSRKDANTIRWLCEQELIQGVNLNGRWAVRVVRTTTQQAGAAIVRDLKAGRDISIGSVIGQYVTLDGKDRERDARERMAQEPVREKLDSARKWIRRTWYVLGGGALFFLVGIIMSWPWAALLAIPAWIHSYQAVDMAKRHGDEALLEETRGIWIQATITGIILWGGTIVAIVLITALSQS